MQSLENSGLGLVTPKQMALVKKKITEKKKAHKRLQGQAKWQQNYRKRLKNTITELSKTSEEAANALKPFNQESPGRPFLEDDQPGIVQAILGIVQNQSSADPRRRSEILRTVKTLDDLHLELCNMGFVISKSATYYRLMPRRSDTKEGQRHV